MRALLHPVTVEASLARHSDNFSLLRHLLALAVIVSHAFSVGTGAAGDEPLHTATGFSLGEHAVNGFFAISGFLVTMSFVRRGPLDYALARALRIAPALVAAVLACAFLLGPALTTLTLADYFRDPQLWRFVEATLTTLKSTAPLPGVFTENPFRFPLGTVWTLKYEVICYVVVLGLGIAGALRHRIVVLALVAGLLAACLGLDLLYPEAGKGTQTSIRLPLIFLTGSLLYLYRERLWFSPAIAAGLALAAWLAAGTAFYQALLFLATAYGVLWLALGAPALRGRPRHERGDGKKRRPSADLSYGLYLYGWPVQQVLFAFFPAVSAMAMIGPAIAVSAVVAALSWYLVEQPALSLKDRLMAARRTANA